jgi:hypothetical protein
VYLALLDMVRSVFSLVGAKSSELQGVLRHPTEQRPAAAEEDRANDELIFVDQPMPRELRYERAAPKDDSVFAGLPLEGLDRAGRVRAGRGHSATRLPDWRRCRRSFLMNVKLTPKSMITAY